MNGNTVFAVKCAILFLFIAAVQFTVGYILYNNESESVYGIYEQSEKYYVGESAKTLVSDIGELSDEIKNGNAEAVKEKFDIVGELDGNTFIADDGGIYDVSAGSETVKISLKNNPLTLFVFDEFLPYGDTAYGGKGVIAFSESDGEKTDIFIMTSDRFFAEFGDIYFTERAVASDSGRVILSTGTAGDELKFLFGAETNSALASETAADIKKIGGTEYLIAAAPVSYGGVNFYYAGIENYSAVTESVAASERKTAALLGASTFLLLIGYALFVYFGVYRDAYCREVKKARGKYYLLTVKPDGTVLKANGLFKKDFENVNVFENITVSASGGSFIKSGCNFIADMAGKDGVKRAVSFVPAKTGRGYRLIGVAAAYAGVEAGGVTKAVSPKEAAGGLAEEMEKRFGRYLAKTDRLLFGVFKIESLYKLEAMFGKTFCDNIFLAMSRKIKKYFNAVYIIGEDKIGVLLSDKKDIDNALTDIKDIINDLNRPVRVADNLVSVGCRAGLVIVDGAMEKETFEYSLHCAYAAIRRSEFGDGETRYYVYHESQKKMYAKFMVYDYNIEEMLKSGSFEMEYQPQYSIAKKRVVGFEALFRVKKRLQVAVNVYDLIVFAERTGKMIFLGDFIFDTGMKFAKSTEGENVCISLNVSPIQFLQAGFVENVLGYYDKYGLKAGSIALEITESFFMSNIDEVRKKLEILRERGINAHLADFGIDYSSLLYLNKLPVSAIKIDRDFIINIGNDKYNDFITQAIINIAKNLNFKSIAEGVETQAQMDILAGMGCDVVQGYLTGKSMSEEKVKELLDEQNNANGSN
jgi:EAL domain-containing protein (putative c-di-GMP-specific phosphodiesterase class I)